jgi:hypothetical protein
MHKYVRTEIILQSKLKHKNILRLYTYFWDAERIVLVLEVRTRPRDQEEPSRTGLLSHTYSSTLREACCTSYCNSAERCPNPSLPGMQEMSPLPFFTCISTASYIEI